MSVMCIIYISLTYFGSVVDVCSTSLSLLNLIFLTSTSKTRVALLGIFPGAPWVPYPNEEGIIKTLFPPLLIPTVPSSQP